MQKILRFLMLALLVVGFTLPAFGKAEAAKVAVLPLVTSEPDDLARRLWTEAYTNQFEYPEYTLIDDTIIASAVQGTNYAVVAKKGPNEALIREIMTKTGADIGVMMVVDQLTEEPIRPNSREDYFGLTIKTRIMLVNNLNGLVKKHRVNDYEEVEYELMVREDYLHKLFKNNCIRELKIVTKEKK